MQSWGHGFVVLMQEYYRDGQLSNYRDNHDYLVGIVFSLTSDN